VDISLRAHVTVNPAVVFDAVCARIDMVIALRSHISADSLPLGNNTLDARNTVHSAIRAANCKDHATSAGKSLKSCYIAPDGVCYEFELTKVCRETLRALINADGYAELDLRRLDPDDGMPADI
jgi:hypothetical protein